MGAETKIGMKVEKETENLKELCKRMEEAIKHEFDKGMEQIDTKELSEVADILKDLCEAKKSVVEACFKAYVLEEMEKESEEGEGSEEDGERRFYRGQPRSESGRFMSRGDGRRSNRGRSSRRGYDDMMMYDDMDYDEMERNRDFDRSSGKMYYSGSGSQSGSGTGSSGFDGGQRGYSESRNDGKEGRSGSARRGYMESKETHKDNSSESKQAKMKELENYMKSMAEDLTEAIEGASPEERAMAKNKLSVLVQKM